MEALRLGWEKELFHGLEYDKVGTDKLFHLVRDEKEVVGIAFVDPMEAKHFYEGVRACIAQMQQHEKHIQMNIQPPDTDTLQHVSGIKRKSGEADFKIVNHLSELVDPKIRQMFSIPFKSDAEARLCIDNIRSQTRKHSKKVIDIGPLLGFMGKRNSTEKPKKHKRVQCLQLSANAISSPDINSLMMVII